MQFDGAVIREQGVTFAIVIVKPHVLNDPADRDQALSAFTLHFGVPTVLMAQDSRGVPSYWGRRDIVDFLANVDPSRIPWQRYTVAA